MNNNIIKVLIGLCLLLLLILLIEWQMGKPTELPAIPPVSTEVNDEQLIELPKLLTVKKAVESYSTMLESPLFIQGRKPITEALEEQTVESIGKVDDLTLLGIYSIKDKKFALFNKKGKDRKYLKKSEGEDVSGWTIAEIKADSVIVEQRGNKETLMLRKPKPKALKRTRSTPRALRKRKKLNPEK